MNDPRAKILLIDDDPFFLKVLSDAFNENGFTVFNANDGIEGIKAFLEKAPDVVVCIEYSETIFIEGVAEHL